MAFWLEEDSDISSLDGNYDVTRARYGADTVADIASLPRPNGQNQGSSCMVLEDGSFYKLGTNPSAGINGWVKL